MSKKPVHEIRLGRIRAALWENETQNGPQNQEQGGAGPESEVPY